MPLVAKNCCKELGGRPVIEDFGVEIQRGEITALVGESGSGKSTIMKCLCGLYDVDSGSVQLDGVAIDDMPAPSWRSKVVYSAQDRVTAGFSLSPWEQGVINGKLGTVNDSGIPEKAMNIAMRLKITPEQFRGPWTSLSGGEAARCKLSLLLAQAPPYLLLDEPTAALDEQTTALVEKEVKASGCGVLWITHNTTQATRFNHVIKLEKLAR